MSADTSTDSNTRLRSGAIASASCLSVCLGLVGVSVTESHSLSLVERLNWILRLSLNARKFSIMYVHQSRLGHP